MVGLPSWLRRGRFLHARAGSHVHLRKPTTAKDRTLRHNACSSLIVHACMSGYAAREKRRLDVLSLCSICSRGAFRGQAGPLWPSTRQHPSNVIGRHGGLRSPEACLLLAPADAVSASAAPHRPARNGAIVSSPRTCSREVGHAAAASSSRISTHSSIHAFVIVYQNPPFLSADVNDATSEGGWARGASCRSPVLRWASGCTSAPPGRAPLDHPERATRPADHPPFQRVRIHALSLVLCASVSGVLCRVLEPKLKRTNPRATPARNCTKLMRMEGQMPLISPLRELFLSTE
jgi:hypothetical protein